ncbi:MAG: TIGR04086 family membrane protein [Ruminococcus sp.]|nr:TIGR04086 family membrane protein [Ruminococcus sp.]MDE6678500.1 TIGR04086 family membrane protein [Ruminococcus sp.]
MRRHRKSVWTNSITSMTIAVFSGIILIFFISLLLSAVMYYILGDMRVSKVFSIIAMVIGTYVSTYFCGKFRRKRGLAEGILCGTIIYIIIMILGFVFVGEFNGIKKLLLLTVSGAVGGVNGVNSKRPKNFTE